MRAVLTTDIARDGRLTVERLRIDERAAPGPAPERQPGAPNRFDRLPDRIDLRNGLPGQGGPDGFGRPGGGRAGGSPGGLGGAGPRGLDIDPRPFQGDRPSGFGGIGGGPGGGPGGLGGPGDAVRGAGSAARGAGWSRRSRRPGRIRRPSMSGLLRPLRSACR
ncbi:hypothetical protein [Methylobacterium durans]|uniref:hypothetical protein n=1 Tax=Methylobacterium durans TaxID=2202825 RepID=UPI001F3B80F7